MFKRISLGMKLYLGFTAILLINAGLGILAFAILTTINKEAVLIATDELPGVYWQNEIAKAADAANIAAARYIMNTDKDMTADLEKRLTVTADTLNKLISFYETTITRDEDRRLWNLEKEPTRAFLETRDKTVIPLSREHKTDKAMAAYMEKLQPEFEALRKAIEDEVNFNNNNGLESSRLIEAAGGVAKRGIQIGLAVAILLSACIGIFLSRSISNALNRVINSLTEGSEQVSSASTQVSQSSQQMAEGASEQASSLEETSASLEEMSSMTKQNSDNARQANVMANDTRQAVEKSRVAMTRMSEAIGLIKNSSDQTAKIVKTIDEIAFQTNLLALNAAVEAARAGDAGKGFAVVAEEVRNLAQRSAEAAKNTASLIEQSQKNADNGVSVSQEVAGILTQIVESVGKLSQLIGEVSSASQEQAKGIEQIGTAVTEMDKLTQSNAASAEESASASEELSAQANELNDMVNALVSIVKGSGASTAPAHSAAGKHSARPAAAKAQKRPAAPARKAHAGHDWSPAGNGGNEPSPTAARNVRTEAVVPLSDDELNDF